MGNRCSDCKHFEADYEDASDGNWSTKPFVACYARVGVANFKQFPFKNTGCGLFHLREGQADG